MRASLLLFAMLLCPALAVAANPERHYFFDLLFLNKPTDAIIAQTYNIEPLRSTIRTTYAGWTDGSELPPAAWYDNLAAAAFPSHKWIAIDHEDWNGETQAGRLDIAHKMAVMTSEIHARRPDLKVGFYSYGIRVHNTNPAFPVGSAQYTSWQAENADYAEMLAVIDGLLPTFYFWFTEDPHTAFLVQNRVPELFESYARESRRLLDLYGAPNRPVYPYIWWERHDSEADLDAYVWDAMLDVSLLNTDGCILWGGYQTEWDDKAWWIQPFRSRFQKRTAQAGQYASVKSAAGQWR